MSRPVGSKNVGSNEFARLFEQACLEENVNPVRILVKLMKSRTQSVKMSAIQTAFRYRYPVQAAIQIPAEAVAQMVMTWDATEALDKPSDAELDRLTAITGKCEAVQE